MPRAGYRAQRVSSVYAALRNPRVIRFATSIRVVDFPLHVYISPSPRVPPSLRRWRSMQRRSRYVRVTGGITGRICIYRKCTNIRGRYGTRYRNERTIYDGLSGVPPCLDIRIILSWFSILYQQSDPGLSYRNRKSVTFDARVIPRPTVLLSSAFYGSRSGPSSSSELSGNKVLSVLRLWQKHKFSIYSSFNIRFRMVYEIRSRTRSGIAASGIGSIWFFGL